MSKDAPKKIFELKCIECNDKVMNVSCQHDLEFYKNIRCDKCIQQDTSDERIILPDISHIKAAINEDGDILCESCKTQVNSSIIISLKHENICINCFLRLCFRCKKNMGSNFVLTIYSIGDERISICSECNDDTFEQWINALDENII